MKDISRFLTDFFFGLFAEKSAEPEGAEGHTLTIAKKIAATGYNREAEEVLQREAVLTYAVQQIGDKYKFGVEVQEDDDDPDEWDCSELTSICFDRAGLEMPDGAQQQYYFCRTVQEPKPGDLGFLWSNTRGKIGHVEMFVGGGAIVGAVGGDVGRVRSRNSSWLDNHPRFRGWRRPPYWERAKEDYSIDPLETPGI